jgi:ATP-dependent Clp endopeptidase proteolytic subunit ClpP
MKKFFNIIPGNGSCCLLLYGEIGGEVKSGDVMRELLEAERTYGRIDVRINSVGGEVYTGIAIFNALRQSKADIHIYIDGIAASMASAIALCGKPVEMSRYARLMIHTVRGGCWGTKKDMADCIQQLDALEGTLCAMYAEKLGRSEEEIRGQYFDGEDHWLSAQEALAQGFIDGIYDVEDTQAAKPLGTLSDKSTVEEIYAIFNNRLEMGAAVTRQQTGQPQTENKMVLLDELKKNPKFKDCTSEEEALRVVAQLSQTAGGAEALAAENATLKSENQAFKDKEAQAFIAEKQKMLDDAEKCGKINAVTRPAFEALLESDFEKGKKALEELLPTKRVMTDLHESPTQESAWDKRKSQIQDRYEQNRYA